MRWTDFDGKLHQGNCFYLVFVLDDRDTDFVKVAYETLEEAKIAADALDTKPRTMIRIGKMDFERKKDFHGDGHIFGIREAEMAEEWWDYVNGELEKV